MSIQTSIPQIIQKKRDETPLSAEEIKKMLPIGKVLTGLGFITLGYKAVDAYVT
jgi:hypothetical protein